MYGPRLVKFAHSRKEMHFQHRQWSFFAIVDPRGGKPRWRSCSSGLGRCQGINGRMTLATVHRPLLPNTTGNVTYPIRKVINPTLTKHNE